MKKQYHACAATLNMEAQMCAIWKRCMELSSLVLFEQALLGHDELKVFANEYNDVIKMHDTAKCKQELEERIKKMYEETGIRFESAGGHVYLIDEWEKNEYMNPPEESDEC